MKSDSASQRDRFNWVKPIYAAVAAILVFLPLLISSSTDFLYIFVIVPGMALIAACALIYAVMRKKLSIAVMVVIFCAVSAAVFFCSFQIRTFARWFLWSAQYKKVVLAEPTPENGELKHFEWDGWGWAGMDTSVYLVLDPADSLSLAASTRQSGKFPGIPCKVPKVTRLESHWYAVTFYTDQQWESCD